MDFVYAAAAFVGGMLLAGLNYRLMRVALRKNNGALFGVMSGLRSLIGIAYMIILYLVAVKTAVPSGYLLLGGAFGLTLPLFFLTPRLMKKKDPDGEGDSNG